jgi:hypothetical protein
MGIFYTIRKGANMITMDEKIRELYYALKPKCEAEHLNLFWEIHKALRRFVKEHPEYDKEWYGKLYEDQ